ncbi:MAG: ParB/RepB/Spo0J family partition protein [Rickettsiaceae bacterium]
MNSKALGRGLSSLLKEEVMPIETNSSNNIDIDLIEPNQQQPRKYFDEEKIKELADSITSHGLVQPIIVVKLANTRYQIVAGERRYRACKLAGLKTIPVIIKPLNPQEVLEVALIENIQRQDLTAIEEAEGLQKLLDEYNYSQAELATVVGKSRSHVTNLLRLNQLPEEIKQMVNSGQLSMGHARCLVGLDNAQEIAQKIILQGLNVRQTESLVNNKRTNNALPSQAKSKQNNIIDEDSLMLSQSLSEKFGVKVIVENSINGGKISFHYGNLEELDLILTKIG